MFKRNCTYKYSSDAFPIQSGLKEGCTVFLLLFNVALECDIKKVQENPNGQKLNGAHQFLVQADDVNLLIKDINATKKNTGILKSK
jgi:hypothetical protein